MKKLWLFVSGVMLLNYQEIIRIRFDQCGRIAGGSQSYLGDYHT